MIVYALRLYGTTEYVSGKRRPVFTRLADAEDGADFAAWRERHDIEIVSVYYGKEAEPTVIKVVPASFSRFY